MYIAFLFIVSQIYILSVAVCAYIVCYMNADITCTSFLISVTFPRLDGITQNLVRHYTKIGAAMNTLSDTAVKMIRTRQQESGDATVS